jgi:hypothetical protein
MMRFADWLSFEKEFNRHRGAVTRHFEAVFAEREQKSEPWPEHPRLAALRASQRYAALPDASRRRLDALIPALARAAQATPDAEATLVRGVDLVEAIASRAAYLALLAENPAGAGTRGAHRRRFELGRPSSSRATRCCSTSCSTTACSTRRSTWKHSRAFSRGSSTTPRAIPSGR